MIGMRTDKEMLEVIKKELERNEYYGLANDRIRWLLNYSETLERRLKRLLDENAKYTFA